MRTTRIAGGLLACASFVLYTEGSSADEKKPRDENELTATLSLSGDDIPLLQCARMLLSGREFQIKRLRGAKFAHGDHLDDLHELVDSAPELVDSATEWLIRDSQSAFQQKSIAIRQASHALKAENELRRSHDYDGWRAQAQETEAAEAAEIDGAAADVYLELLKSVDSARQSWINGYIRKYVCGSARLSTNGTTWDEDMLERSARFEANVEEAISN